MREEKWRVGTTQGTGCGSFHRALLPMTPNVPDGSEPDLRRFVSFTLFSLLLESQFCFVFYDVINCHVHVLISS